MPPTLTDTTPVPRISDPYPSRREPDPRLLPRKEPVVAGTADDGPLTAEQLADYERDGFLVLPGLLDGDEVAGCLGVLDRLRRSEDVKERPESIVEPDDRELRSLFAVHRPEIGGRLADVAADERLAGTARQIVGGDVYVHQSRVNLKPGFAGREFYWHSDFETWHVEDGMPGMRAVSCSILLTPNVEQNGPLMLVPGSHREFLTCVGETPDDHYKTSLRRQEYGVPDEASLAAMVERGGITSVTGPAGTVVLFDCNTMHGSNGNITPLPRTNLFFVYNHVENRLADPFCGKPPRPEFIASREHTPRVVPHPLPSNRRSAPR